MREFKNKTNISTQSINVEFSFSDQVDLDQLAIFSALIGPYVKDINMKRLGIENVISYDKQFPKFIVSPWIQIRQNEKDLSIEYWMSLTFEYIDSKIEEFNNNIFEGIKSFLSFPTLDESYREVKKNVDLFIQRASSEDYETKFLRNAISKSCFDNGENYILSNFTTKSVNENISKNKESYIYDSFNKFASTFLNNLVDVEYYSNVSDEKFFAVHDYVKSKFVPNPNLKPYVVKSCTNGELEQGSVEKTTSNTLNFYFLDFKSKDKYTNAITMSYIDELVLEFYLNEIRLKHNFIYSPVLRNVAHISFTNHEVQRDNLDAMIKLETEFYDNIKTQEVRTDVVNKVRDEIKSRALALYEVNAWRSLIYMIESFGVDVESSEDVDHLYDLAIDIANNLDASKIDLSVFKFIGRTQIKGEKNDI